MCLRRVCEIKFKTKTIKCWKVFEYRIRSDLGDIEPKMRLSGPYRHTIFIQGVNIDSRSGGLIMLHSDVGQNYSSGYHCYRYKKAAIADAGDFRRNVIVLPVYIKVSDIVATGTQRVGLIGDDGDDGDGVLVIVCRELEIRKIDWDRAEKKLVAEHMVI